MEKPQRKTVNLMQEVVDDESPPMVIKPVTEKKEIHSYALEIQTDIDYRQQFKVTGE